MTPAFSTIRFYTFTSGYKRLLYDYAAPVLLHLFHRFGLKAETGIQNKFNLNLCIMKSLRNRVQLIGHVGQDPEIIAFDGGKKLAKFRLATNDVYTKANGDKVEDTQWHNIVAWGKSAELVEKLLEKGRQVAVDGKLTNRSYEDKEGAKRFSTEVVANEFVLLGKKPS